MGQEPKSLPENGKIFDNYIRNITAEKVLAELLLPTLKSKTNTNRHRSTSKNDSKPISEAKIDIPKKVASLALTTLKETKFENTKRKRRSYTLPSNICQAIADYEKQKSELASNIQKCLICCCCFESIRPLKIEETEQFRRLFCKNGKNLDSEYCSSVSEEDVDLNTTSSIDEYYFNKIEAVNSCDKNDFIKTLTRLFQCKNGHPLCESCLARVLADGRLRNVETTCPFCRVQFSMQTVIRNTIAEEILLKLPTECSHCFESYTYEDLFLHEKNCQMKNTNCPFHILGCTWSGTNNLLSEHYNTSCNYFKKPAKELQPDIKEFIKKQKNLLTKKEKILSYYSQRLAFVDFQLNAHRTDEYMSRLYFKSGNIAALGKTFSIKLWVGGIDPQYPTVSKNRYLEYQLFLRGPKGNMESMKLAHTIVTPPPERYKIYSKCYSDCLDNDGNRVGEKWKLNMDPVSINLILANSSIVLRLFLFLVK